MTTKGELRHEIEQLECRVGRQMRYISDLRDLVEAQRDWDTIPVGQRGFLGAQLAKHRLETANAKYDETWQAGGQARLQGYVDLRFVE